VVIDPGHGGTNAGAPSIREGLYEKSVTLAYAQELATRLRARGLRVALTRRDDRYLSLRQRARFANERRADLFVSLHANASFDRSRRGFETFVLSPDALDIDGRALRVDDGAPRLGVERDISFVLDDIERGLSLPRAAMLAQRIQRQMRRVRGRQDDRGVRQESHHVLLGATMPAVLVEIGFIDHPIEGGELLEAKVRADICEALAKAIARE